MKIATAKIKASDPACFVKTLHGKAFGPLQIILVANCLF